LFFLGDLGGLGERYLFSFLRCEPPFNGVALSPQRRYRKRTGAGISLAKTAKIAKVGIGIPVGV
jgi:hypothetical protein